MSTDLYSGRRSFEGIGLIQLFYLRTRTLAICDCPQKLGQVSFEIMPGHEASSAFYKPFRLLTIEVVFVPRLKLKSNLEMNELNLCVNGSTLTL